MELHASLTCPAPAAVAASIACELSDLHLQELGRRAGVPVGIVARRARHFLAHPRLTRALVLDPATGALVEVGGLGVLQWRCGHQLAAELLNELQPRYERIGDLTRAVQVARMPRTLPFEAAQDAEVRLRRVSARLN